MAIQKAIQKEVHPALQWLLDREALRQLMVDYFAGVDERDFERVAACFTPDVRAEYGGQLYTGRDALVEFIRGVRFFDTTFHCMGGQLVEVAGNEARMTTQAMLAHHGHTGDGEGIEYHNSAACYVDVLTRIDGRWLVCERAGAPVRPTTAGPAPETDDPALRWLVDRVRARDVLAQWALGMIEKDERLPAVTYFVGVPAVDLLVERNGGSAIVECCGLLTEREPGETKHPVLGLPLREERTRSVRWRHRLVRRDGRFRMAERGSGVALPNARADEPPATADAAVRALVDRELVRDAIARSALAQARDDKGTSCLVGNQEIEIRGDEARVRSYVYVTRREAGGESHWGRGLHHWHDRLERRSDGWHLAERRDVDLLAKR